MSQFQANLAADANRVFTNTAEFGETVLIRPGNGTPRPIAAQVFRSPPGPIVAGQRAGVAWKMRVQVSTDPVLGISPGLLDLGTWTMDVAAKVGDAATTRQLVRIVRQDAAMILLEVE